MRSTQVRLQILGLQFKVPSFQASSTSKTTAKQHIMAVLKRLICSTIYPRKLNIARPQKWMVSNLIRVTKIDHSNEGTHY